MTGGLTTTVVVLDRIEPGEPVPAYCVHGRATCLGGCGEWVWLGHATHEVVAAGRATPLCRQCADRLIPADAVVVDRVRDHLRVDGPHS